MLLQGEGIADRSTWVVKTHYPERSGWLQFPAERAIVLVRYPFDSIDSYFNMCMTNSHNASLHESEYERFREKWYGLAENEIQVGAVGRFLRRCQISVLF